MEFSILSHDHQARRAQLQLAHGVVDTPAFMPVGTYGGVRMISPDQIAATGAQIMLGNTFHLWLRPGEDLMNQFNGLHRFINWPKTILTDSGGFQVFSLGALRKISEKGVLFASPINGSKHLMTPENSMAMQKALNSDIVMIFDECTPYPASHKAAEASMRLSLRWAKRSRVAHDAYENSNALFGIVQGGMYEDLREASLAGLMEIGYDGYAIGGLSVGEPKEEFLRVLTQMAPKLPWDRPRYLMGVGTPRDLVDGVRAGIDMFDCVMPTRNGRNGWLYTRQGVLKIRHARFRQDQSEVDSGCACPLCSGYSRAYLHHLQKNGDSLGAMLASLHNLYYYQDLMAGLRQAITEGDFEKVAGHWLRHY